MFTQKQINDAVLYAHEDPTALGNTIKDIDEFVRSDKKQILSYSIDVSGTDYIGTIDHTAKTIAVEVPNGTTVTALVATFTSSKYSAVDVSNTAQVSGTTANDFTSPVAYTITAKDGTENDYTVTVTVAAE